MPREALGGGPSHNSSSGKSGSMVRNRSWVRIPLVALCGSSVNGSTRPCQGCRASSNLVYRTRNSCNYSQSGRGFDSLRVATARRHVRIGNGRPLSLRTSDAAGSNPASDTFGGKPVRARALVASEMGANHPEFRVLYLRLVVSGKSCS